MLIEYYNDKLKWHTVTDPVPI